jgi:uncharacterized protein with FMN-binding domain/succinate dehydrogenase/fumarate reductase flavoprotein subunit
MKKIVALLLVLMVFMAGFSALAETFTAEAPGFGGSISVSVAVEDGKITGVDIAGDQETPAIGIAAFETLAQRILDAQNADIDDVAGATVTSAGVKTAASEAIAEALGGGATVEAKLAPGVYTAEAGGFSLVEKVPVTVTVDENSIVSIDASEDCAETTIMLRTVKELLIPRIIEAQSVGVDAICGATATSNAIKSGVADCLAQALEAAGSPQSALANFYTVPEKAHAGEEVSLEADVLVVGLGGAGATAAISAAEAGLKVIAVEKAGKVGGTSSIASEPMAINPKRFQEEHNDGKDYIDASVMKEAWLAYTTGADGTQKAKEEVVDVMFNNSGDALDWLVYDHGFTFGEPRVGFTAADVYLCRYNYVTDGIPSNERRIGAQAFYDNLMKEFMELGGEYYLETEGRELIFDEETNAVTGAVAVSQDGTLYNIKAKAVVLATGGFAGNPDMMDKYLSQNKYFDFTTPGGWMLYGSNQNDGKMIASAIENGAGTYNISMAAMVHNTATEVLLRDYPVTVVEGETNPVTGRPQTRSINDIPQIMAQSANILVVGNNGKRFVDEASMGMLGSWANGREFYSIWSAEQIDDVKANGFKYVSTSRYLGQGGVPVGEPMDQIYDVLDTAMKAGIVYKAETLPELAEQIGIPGEALVETVEAYNAACASGVDEEHGKKAEYLDAIGYGPYYCVVGTPYCYSTVGGLDVDRNLNVLDIEGNPIAGLYAAGEDCLGCLMSDERAYVTFGGGAQGWAVTSGYYVGRVLGDALAK